MSRSENNGRLVKAVLVMVLVFATALLAAGVRSASAHNLGYDSVDGREIRYEDHTRFDDAYRFGVSKWNALDDVNIRKSNSGVDLEFRDYRNCGDGTLAYWKPRSGVDFINFNDCEMKRVNEFQQRGTAVHELGHALGLAHPNGTRESERWRKSSIMYGFCCTPFNTPQRHDRQDYNELWGGNRANRATDGEPSANRSVDMEPLYAFEASDKRELVGFATNVFRGRVVEETGREGAPLSGPGGKVLPRTGFSVEVLKNVKGSLKGEVMVLQAGGYDEEGQEEVRVEGDSPLRPGEEYVFSVSREEGKKGRYVVVAQPFGAVPVEEDGEAVEAEFEEAEAEQIPFDPDAS